MNILKNTALATILSLSALNANADYDGDADFEITVDTASQIVVAINGVTSDTIELSELVEGDEFDIDITVNITGAATVGDNTARTITCIISGGAYVSASSGTDVSTAGDTYLVYVTEDGTNSTTEISQLSLSLDDDCSSSTDGVDNVLSVVSSALDGPTAGTSYSTGTMTFSVSYDVATNITSYT